ncbi:MAG: ubiquitin-like domain-containing protein [Chloroflexi bacterium]|nr:ubiquitin-like domain-containing protein [Chloroflexota bacterium]
MNADRGRRILLLLIIAFCCCALVVTGGLLAATLLRWAGGGAIVAELTPAAQRTIRIIDAGQARQLQTALHEPLPILARAGISLGEMDKVWINGALAKQESLPDWTVPASQIEIRRAVQLRILDDGAEVAITSAAETIGEALDEAGIRLGASDEINLPLDTRLDRDTDLRITRAMRVRLLVDGEVIEARTQVQRVADLLDELELSLGSLDFTRPGLGELLGADADIEVVRVVVEELVEREETPPGNPQYRPDPNTPLDRTTVIQQAQPGIRETITRLRYENGREVSRETGEPQLVQQPQNQIIGYGTKAVVLGTVNTPQGPREYWRVLCMYATSYSPRSNNGNTQTAIGQTLRTGIVASNPDLIPYRSDVFVPGYGVGYMADTAGYRSSPYWIDLGFSDADYTRDWHEYVKVYLLTPVPAKVSALLPAWKPMRTVPGGCN